ncbi:MAG: alpha/beta hydrolase [Anaerolineales bacterium]|nr:alpha/beta hydrolase [Anaerolineales bacterium]
MPFAEGIHYSFHNSGNETRPPLVFIHGAGGIYLTWHPYLRRLEGETTYALDLPGHGQSGDTGRQSIEAYAEDVIRFMDGLKIKEAVLVGVSMGSAVALTLALKQPEKISGLVLLGGGAKMRVANAVLETAANPNTFESAVEMINSGCFSRNASPDLVNLSKQHMLKISPSVLLGDFQACNQFNIMDRLSEIQIPTLILCGAHDAMMPPKFSRSLCDGIPNSQFHLVEDAGHMLQLEQPDVVAALLKKFLDELPLRSAP